jgi:CRISPR-associated protein Cas5d
MKTFCLEVTGDFACFTRPEMKVERVSYDVMTPSAARAVFEAILWKPAIRWQVTKIEVLKPIKWITLRRNEVGSKASASSQGIFADEPEIRQQRAGLFLRDVAYRIHAGFEMCDAARHKPNFPHLSKRPINDPDEQRAADEANTPVKFINMFERRASKGQCVNQPYLGCREFAADFRLIKPTDPMPNWSELTPAEKRELGFEQPRDLGWMLYDMDYGNIASPNPRFFRAELKNGVLDLANAEVRG